MADPTKDKDSKPLYDADLPADEEAEEPEELDEATEAGEDDDGEFEAAAAAPSAGRFGFGRKSGGSTDEEKHPIGSVRESHERVHINDAPSAIFALVCAAALIAVLAVAWFGTNLPAPNGPELTRLIVPTAEVVASSSASVASPAASASAAASTPTVVASPSN
jgi:hypothetical protein